MALCQNNFEPKESQKITYSIEYKKIKKSFEVAHFTIENMKKINNNKYEKSQQKYLHHYLLCECNFNFYLSLISTKYFNSQFQYNTYTEIIIMSYNTLRMFLISLINLNYVKDLMFGIK